MTTIWVAMILLFFNPTWAAIALPFLSTQDIIKSVTVVGLLIGYLLITNLMQQVSELNKKTTILVQNSAIRNYVEEQGINNDDE